MVDLFYIKSVGSEKFQLYSRNKTSKVLDRHETRFVSSSPRLFKRSSHYFQQAFRNYNGMDDDDNEITMASGLADDSLSAAGDDSYSYCS
jgi:hypothetical protein